MRIKASEENYFVIYIYKSINRKMLVQSPNQPNYVKTCEEI